MGGVEGIWGKGDKIQQIEAKSTCHIICHENIKLVNKETCREDFAKLGVAKLATLLLTNSTSILSDEESRSTC